MALIGVEVQEALVAGSFGKYNLVDDAEIPSPREDQVLCKVSAIALNPADAKMADYSATPGSIGGNDFAGEIIEIGEHVKRFKKGDRILAFTFGLNPTDKITGAFGQYALATEDLACTIPEHMSYNEASTLGLAIATAGTALFQALKLPLPTEPAKKPFHVLVSGGATSTGAMAIQMLKCAGLIPIATCSPANTDLVKSLGAEKVFDYHSPSSGSDIRTYTNDSLAHVFDCVTDAETMKMCYDTIGASGGKYVALDPFVTRIQYSRRDVQADWLMIYSLFGNPVRLAGVYGRPARPQDREFASRLFPMAETLLSQGLLKPHPMEIRTGGLKSVACGIDDLRAGRVRARKLVYPMTA
ncbi:MAG: putative secondary metabolism biosynthetic enzyme [Bathelium mastoideum]|nr:MAG: putative secondary metabolism biosynthetic enzyme [Bathelium mastoideum]